jgi:hypothetical protein
MKGNWPAQIFSLKEGKEKLSKLSMMSHAYSYYCFSYHLKGHKREETFVGSDFKFCTFFHFMCLKINVM